MSWDIDGVPLLLPRDLCEPVDTSPSFLLLVFRQRDADDLEQWLATGTFQSEHAWLRRYFALLPNAKIVVFEDVRKQVKAGNVLWQRFETLPID